ncbi:MAG: hypothetical protein FWB95_02715 [Treponema sp.]|nr:hypothetical protein [Treponema sp.]
MKLTDVIGKEQFIFDDKTYTDDDFQKMNAEELATLKARITNKITNISDIIADNKETESKDWLKRRKFVMSLYNKIIPYINSHLKKFERNIGDCFMNQARIILPADEYEMILSNAGREFRQGREGKNANL